MRNKPDYEGSVIIAYLGKYQVGSLYTIRMEKGHRQEMNSY